MYIFNASVWATWARARFHIRSMLPRPTIKLIFNKSTVLFPDTTLEDGRAALLPLKDLSEVDDQETVQLVLDLIQAAMIFNVLEVWFTRASGYLLKLHEPMMLAHLKWRIEKSHVDSYQKGCKGALKSPSQKGPTTRIIKTDPNNRQWLVEVFEKHDRFVFQTLKFTFQNKN